MNEKIEALREKFKNLDMQGMIITNPVSIRYLTNIDAEGVLLLTRRENVYITDGRYMEAVNRALTIEDEIIVYDFRELTREDYENFFTFCENVGFEEAHLTYAKYKEYMHKYKINNFEETEGLIEKMRIVKKDDEIDCIKKACLITDKCFEHLKEFIKVGMTEKEIAFEIEKFFLQNGADGLAFETIVASGVNSSMPHAVPTDKKIEEGDPITIDMGCRCNGYCSDMTRTVFAKQVPQYMKPVYDLVLKTQLKVLEDMKEGANLKLISKGVDSDFKLNGASMVHSLGHGVGLDIHEYPFINSKSDFILKENMVITDEPGIYIPGRFGVRIEDTVLITKYASQNLTLSEKSYVIVG
ncbi:MAG: aminopeptidase P family protein [Clostridia bacterium]|nr:aminopeptidase P family protein [Clostridia bacterium]